MYKNANCKCGVKFYSYAMWINKNMCICRKCGEDITKRCQVKKPIIVKKPIEVTKHLYYKIKGRKLIPRNKYI